jgi:hypothetical protein
MISPYIRALLFWLDNGNLMAGKKGNSAPFSVIFRLETSPCLYKAAFIGFAEVAI